MLIFAIQKVFICLKDSWYVCFCRFRLLWERSLPVHVVRR